MRVALWGQEPVDLCTRPEAPTRPTFRSRQEHLREARLRHSSVSPTARSGSLAARGWSASALRSGCSEGSCCGGCGDLCLRVGARGFACRLGVNLHRRAEGGARPGAGAFPESGVRGPARLLQASQKPEAAIRLREDAGEEASRPACRGRLHCVTPLPPSSGASCDFELAPNAEALSSRPFVRYPLRSLGPLDRESAIPARGRVEAVWCSSTSRTHPPPGAPPHAHQVHQRPAALAPRGLSRAFLTRGNRSAALV